MTDNFSDAKISEYMFFTKLCDEGQNPYEFVVKMANAIKQKRKQELEVQSKGTIDVRTNSRLR